LLLGRHPPTCAPSATRMPRAAVGNRAEIARQRRRIDVPARCAHGARGDVPRVAVGARSGGAPFGGGAPLTRSPAPPPPPPTRACVAVGRDVPTPVNAASPKHTREGSSPDGS